MPPDTRTTKDAGGENCGDGIGFDQVHEIGERQKIGRRQREHDRRREDRDRQREFCASKDGVKELTHRARPKARVDRDAGDEFAHDPPIAHVQNAVGIVIDLGDLIGDEEDGYALIRQATDKFVDALLVANVDADGRDCRGSGPWDRSPATSPRTTRC